MRPTPVTKMLSVDDYLVLEQSSPVRHEYVKGETFAMPGGSDEHNRLAVNLASALVAGLRGGLCRAFVTGMKLRVHDTLFYYPDLFIACDPGDSAEYFRTSPSVVVEILSPSTEATDRGEKLHNYRRIPTLKAYLLISQEIMRVEMYRRQGEAAWIYEALESITDAVTLTTPPLQIPLATIYDGWRAPESRI